MRLACTALFVITASTVWADGLATQNAHPEWAPLEPSQVFEKTPDEITKVKGEGSPQYAVNAEGKWLASIDYQESWFQWNEPLRVEYIVLPEKEQKIIQLTVHFPDKADRKVIIDKVSSLLGAAQQGKSGEGAPSEYFANWIRDAVRYDFQDFGDYKEMYVSPARFSPTERYKLSDDTLTLQRSEGRVLKADGSNTVLLLGLCSEKKSKAMNSLSLFVRDRGKDEDKGTIMPLPIGASGTSPQLSLHDFDGDRVDDALVSANMPDGHTAAWILTVKGKSATVLFDSSKTEVPSLAANGYVSIAATDTNKDGTYDLVAVQNAADGSQTHSTLHMEKGKWTASTK